ncbi:transporter substrate-binding domain-containing protein [Maridesulfovibrio sp.]|uniref:substrate-binding periplasmic protein n=1 Tax=Maridesulfovibrio sp. TaxID=2795000 RepID=UPI002A18C9C7|nr:transporter substrate-binding domain-containing protein [Maridesulfovibrio sp.]
MKVGVAHFPPWATVTEGKAGGFDPELVDRLLKRIGFKAEFLPMKFSDLLNGLKSGEIDIAASLLFRRDRNEYIRYLSPPYRTQSDVRFYARKSSGIRINKYIDMAGYKIAISKGVRYFPVFDMDDRMVKRAYPSQLAAFKALAEGEVDLAVCSGVSGEYYIRELGAQNTIRKCLFSYVPRLMPVYIGVSRKSPLMSRTDELDQILGSMKEFGVLNELANQQGVSLH